MTSKLEPAIWPRDTGQRILCFDRCQLIIAWMSNIKEVHGKPRLYVSGNLLVYVIGLHAVQFENNWMKKIPSKAKIGRGRRPSPIWLSEEFFESTYFQIGQACSRLTY